MLRLRRRVLETSYGQSYTGTQGETPDTAKGSPTVHRASARPYHRYSRAYNRIRTAADSLTLLFFGCR